MSSGTTAGLGRWREGRPVRQGSSRARARTFKWVSSALLSALLLFAALIIAYICWQWVFGSPPKTEFVPFYVSEFQSPELSPLPWGAADRQKIAQAKIFTKIDPDEKTGADLTSEVMSDRLARLETSRPDQAIVVYLAARTTVDQTGAVQIVAADANRDSPKTLLPLRKVLASLKKCSARNKLLVLDVVSVPASPLDLGGTSDAAADLLPRELSDENDPARLLDPKLMVLAACSPGESALWSEPNGQSIFGFYFLHAFADPEADANDDRVVSASELAAYVKKNVDQWARQHRGRSQHPLLLGSKRDFDLAVVDRSRLKAQSEGAGPPAVADKDKSADDNKSADNDKASDQSKLTEKDKANQQDKSADNDKTVNKAKIADQGQPAGATKESAQDGAKSSDERDRLYPQWLADGWGLRERWVKEGDMQLAPRALRRLEASLLRAEMEWRSGTADLRHTASPNGDVAALRAAMEAARRVTRPSARSVGQARAFGQTADPALVSGLKAVLERRRRPDVSATTPEQINSQLAAARDAFLATLKEKTSLDLAQAVAEAIADERFDLDTVTFIDALVAKSAVPRDVIELRLMQLLARRAAGTRPRSWNDETAKMIWQTVLLAEEANNRPATLPWIKDLLEAADVLRHEAQVLLLPEAYGYASEVRISKTWQAVRDAYGFIDNCQTRIGDGRRALNRAKAVLPAYLPYLEMAGRVGQESLWRQAAEAAHLLDLLLERPSRSSESDRVTRDRLEQLNGGLADATLKLDAQLNELLRPFHAEAVHSVIRQCESSRPDPGLATEVEAILATPFVPAADRARLRAAGLALDRRLSELPVRSAESTSDSSRASGDRLQAVQELVKRRVGRLSALWKLASPEPAGDGSGDAGNHALGSGLFRRSTDAEPASNLAALARTWGELASASSSVHAKLLDLDRRPDRQDDDDRVGWIAPAFAVVLSSNPAREIRDRDHLAAWAWLAKHYQHESLDLNKLVDRDRFYELAAIACARSDRLAPGTEIVMDLAEASASGVSLSRRMNKRDMNVRIRVAGPGAGARQKLTLKVLGPDDPRVVVSPASVEVDIPERSDRTQSIKIEWIEDVAGESRELPPAGIVVQANVANERPYHFLVPLTIQTESSTPRLVLRTDPAQGDDVPFNRFVLRTLPGRQSFYLVVHNPSPIARKLIVDILSGQSVLAGGAGKAFDLSAGGTAPVPSFEAPDLKPDVRLPEAPEGLSVRLRDAADGQTLDLQPLQPAIAAPLEYVEVLRPRFLPANGVKPNRLEVSIRSLPQMTGPPAVVKLNIPTDKEFFRALLEPPQGTLEGPLKPGGGTLDLYAENLKLDDTVDEQGMFQIAIDGLQRAIWYQTRFVSQGARPQVATVFEIPQVRFDHRAVVKPGERAKLHVVFAVDNAPADCKLMFELGRLKDGKMVRERPRWEATPQERHIGFYPKGEAGAILFEASVQDWVTDVDIAQIRGPRDLEATLINPRSRKVIASLRKRNVILDDLPPQDTSIELDDEVEKGTGTLDVKATVASLPAGIEDVAFILGSEGDFAKAEADGKIFVAKPLGDDLRAWRATLTLPKDLVGKLGVTARFKSRNGLSTFVHKDVLVREPPPSPAEAAAKPVPDKPGAIRGKVTENDIAQPDLTVLLIDPKAKADENPVKDQTKTKSDGTYSFPEVKPGRYQVLAVKDATNRRDTKDVVVPSGKTVEQNLDLMKP
jgi:hypothetical protein